MKAIIITLLILVSQSAIADPSQCFELAAKHAGVDRDLLVAIAKTESNINPRARHANTNGTYDIGIMQVNSTHLTLLKRAGFSETDLWDSCTNIFIGAQILKESIKFNGNNWRAVGAYNAGYKVSNEHKRELYVVKVRKEYYRLKSQTEKGLNL